MWFFSRKSRRGSKANTPRPQCRPRLELLEDRAVPSTTPAFGWAQSFGPLGGSTAVAVDNLGNLYTAGSFADQGAGSDFDPAHGSHTPSSVLTSAGGQDVFVAKYDGNGAYQWAVRIGTANDDIGAALALSTDTLGRVSVYVTGMYNGTFAVTGTPVLNGFVAKLNGADGSLAWLDTPGTVSALAGKNGRGIAVDSSGNAYATFANDPNIATANDYYSGHALGNTGNVGKFDAATGRMTWNYQIAAKNNSGGATTYGVAVAGSNVYVTGIFVGTGSGAVNFNPAGNYKLSASYNSGYDLKLTTSGAFVWVTPFTAISGGRVQSYSIAVDGPDSAGKGNVYTYGGFQGKVAFDATHTLNAGYVAAFITKLDKNGKLAWVDQLGGDDNAYPSYYSGGLTVVSTGGSYDGVYVTGQFDNTPSGFLGLTSQGGRDIFVARFDSTSGSLVWAVDAGGTLSDHGNAVAVDSSGNVYTTGTINRYDSVAGYVADFDPLNSHDDDRDLLTVDSKTSFLWKIVQL